MSLTLAESGLLDALSKDRDQLVCDAYKDARTDERGGAGNETFTAESVLGALNDLFNRTVGHSLAVLDTRGFFTVADVANGTIDDVVHQKMSEDWYAAINS